MLKHRVLLAALLAFCLALGPAVNAWAQGLEKPCESMAASMPGDDCCGDAMEQSECLSACLAVAPVMASTARVVFPFVAALEALGPLSFRPASVLAPPDIAPPKRSAS